MIDKMTYSWEMPVWGEMLIVGGLCFGFIAVSLTFFKLLKKYQKTRATYRTIKNKFFHAAIYFFVLSVGGLFSFYVIYNMFEVVKINQYQIVLSYIWPRPDNSIKIDEVEYVEYRELYEGNFLDTKGVHIYTKDGKRYESWGVPNSNFTTADKLIEEFKRMGIKVEKIKKQKRAPILQ